MPRYLVVAHQTASSAELLQAIRSIIQEHDQAAFVLLVPETPAEDLLDWQEGDPKSIAGRVAEGAKARFEEMGAIVIRATVADPSPLKALEEELAQDRESYDGIIIATLPLQRSRWLSMDQPRRIERRFGLPVTHVVGHSVTMTREHLIDGLNEDLNLELETVLRGVLHAAAGRGMLGHELREMLKSELPGELAHAMFLADKIVALGGDVRIHPNPPLPLDNSRQLLPENIAAEKKAVSNYARRIDQAAEYGDKGLMIRLEELLAAETDHLEALERLAR
jgi:bacterioferritin (cytochrome b1)